MSEEKTQIKLNNKSYTNNIRFGLIGPSKSGKSSLIEKICYNVFPEITSHGPGISWYSVKIDVNNEKFKIIFFDQT